jgi:hypothetical protein
MLICDDEKANFQSFCDLAYEEDVDLDCFEYWEAAKNQLSNNWDDYDAIILDYKGKISSSSSNVDQRHLPKAVKWLSDQRGNRRFIPLFIYTAHEEECKENFPEEDFEIHSKSIEFDVFINKIKNKIEQNPSEKIKKKYPELFTNNTEKVLGSTNVLILVSLLAELDEDPSSQKPFNTIRDIFEGLLKKANKIDQNMLPNECIKPDGKPNLEWSCRYLTNEQLDILGKDKKVVRTFEKGKHYVANEHVSSCIRLIKQLSSMFSHEYNEPFTINAYRACLFALLEFIAWFTNHIEIKYPSKI